MSSRLSVDSDGPVAMLWLLCVYMFFFQSYVAVDHLSAVHLDHWNHINWISSTNINSLNIAFICLVRAQQTHVRYSPFGMTQNNLCKIRGKNNTALILYVFFSLSLVVSCFSLFVFYFGSGILFHVFIGWLWCTEFFLIWWICKWVLN